MRLDDIKNNLFNNVTVKQTIFKNTFWMAMNHGIGMLLQLGFIIYIARVLGATEYGRFNFALAFATLYCVFFGLGIDQIITRDFARDGEKEKEFSAIISLKITLGLITLISILISSLFITKDPVILRMIWILGLFTFLENFCATIYAFFQARQKMEYHALTQIIGSLLLVGIGLFAMFKFPNVESLAYSYLISISIVFISVLLILHLKVQPIHVSWNIDIWKKLLKVSWPLALVALCFQIYNHIDSVMMGYFGQITETGWYNAAFKITSVALIPMSLITTSFYPVLSKASGESFKKFQKLWNIQMELIIMIVLPLVIGGIVLAPKIIDFFYGSDFLPSVLAFQILIATAGIVFIYDGSFKKSLIIFNQQKKIFFALFLGTILNVFLNLFLIPRYSLYGAATATLITQLLIFFLELIFILKFTEVRPFNYKILITFIGVILCSLLMYLIISSSLVYSLNLIVIILIGMAIYFLSFFGYKKLTEILISTHGTR